MTKQTKFGGYWKDKKPHVPEKSPICSGDLCEPDKCLCSDEQKIRNLVHAIDRVRENLGLPEPKQQNKLK